MTFLWHFHFSFLLLPYFLIVTLRQIDPVFDDRVGEEEGEGLEDFEDQGKQPFDHVYEALFMHVI